MLKIRIITALILAPTVIAAIYWLPPLPFAVFFAALAAFGVWEWAGLAGASSSPQRATFVTAYAIGIGLLLLQPQFQPLVLQLTVAAWVLATLAVLTFPWASAWLRRPLLLLPLGWLLMVGLWCAFVELRSWPHGASWLLWSLLICWAADIGAYFAGRAIGKRKLAPRLSPGKTWEGAIGGWLLTLLVCGGGLAYWATVDVLTIPVITLLVAMAIIGDLFESMAKRLSAVKDSGSLLPGHGGVLDRIDSVMAVVPIAALLLPLLGFGA